MSGRHGIREFKSHLPDHQCVAQSVQSTRPGTGGPLVRIQSRRPISRDRLNALNQCSHLWRQTVEKDAAHGGCDASAVGSYSAGDVGDSQSRPNLRCGPFFQRIGKWITNPSIRVQISGGLPKIFTASRNSACKSAE